MSATGSSGGTKEGDGAAFAEALARRHFTDLAELAGVVGESLGSTVVEVARVTVDTLRSGGTLLFAGNGGSAADAQHLAAEYVVRFSRERPGLSALALTVDTSVLTAGANDYGYENVFARQIQAVGRSGDLLFLHSTSGESENLIVAAEAARERGVRTVGMLARDGGSLRSRVDRAVVVPTDSTARAQEMHLAIGHVVCELVDRAIAAGGEPTWMDRTDEEASNPK